MQPLLADFEISEGIFSRARIEDSDSVCLWLGANVMLQYSREEVAHSSSIFLQNQITNINLMCASLIYMQLFYRRTLFYKRIWKMQKPV